MGHPPVLEEAAYHFKYRVLPRRLPDKEQEEWFLGKYGYPKSIYRKLNSVEINSEKKTIHLSMQYPLFDLDITRYAHFGLGTGIYMMQILALACVMITGAAILVPNMIAFGDHGDFFLSYTIACDNEGPQLFTALSFVSFPSLSPVSFI